MDDARPIRNYVKQVADALARRIRGGAWAGGTQLPSVRQLAGEYEVSSATAHAALKALARRGLVQPRARKGFFVRPEAVQPGGVNVKAKQGTHIALALSQRPVPQRAEPPTSEPEPEAGLVPEPDDSWGLRLRQGAERVLLREGFEPVTLPLDLEPSEGHPPLFERLDRLSEQVRGVLVLSPRGQEAAPVLAGLDERELPWVTLTRVGSQRMYNYAAVDHLGAGQRLGGCLARMESEAAERVLILTRGLRTRPSNMDFVLGVYQSMLEGGMSTREVEVLECEGTQAADGRRATAAYLDREARPPAVILTLGDLLALGAVRACRERGLRVPEDVGVVGGTGLSVAEHAHPPLTVHAQPMAAVGHQAGAMLVEMIREQVNRMLGRRIPGPIVFRESFRAGAAVERWADEQYRRQAEALSVDQSAGVGERV